MVEDEKKHSEMAMGEPASAREKTAQNADEAAMGRPTAPKDIDARSDAQIAMGQPATSAQATAEEADELRSARLRRPTRWRSGRLRMSPWSACDERETKGQEIDETAMGSRWTDLAERQSVSSENRMAVGHRRENRRKW